MPGYGVVPAAEGTSLLLLGVRVFQLPLAPSPFHTLSGAVTLHVRAGGVVDQRELEKGAEHEALAHLQKQLYFYPSDKICPGLVWLTD
jgi:hypothetical protein